MERPWYEKFCKVCQMAGKPVQVHTSHNTLDCKLLYTALRSIYITDFKDDEYDAEGARSSRPTRPSSRRRSPAAPD